MKKSVYLFIIWAVAAVLLTVLYQIAPMFLGPYVIPAFQRVLLTCSMFMSFAMLAIIHGKAKIEKAKWLSVTSAILFVLCIILYSLRLFHAVAA